MMGVLKGTVRSRTIDGKDSGQELAEERETFGHHGNSEGCTRLYLTIITPYCFTLLYSTLLYSTLLYSTVLLYCAAVLCSTSSTVLLYSALPRSTLICFTHSIPICSGHTALSSYLQAAQEGGCSSIAMMKGGYSYHCIAPFKPSAVHAG